MIKSRKFQNNKFSFHFDSSSLEEMKTCSSSLKEMNNKKGFVILLLNVLFIVFGVVLLIIGIFSNGEILKFILKR